MLYPPRNGGGMQIYEYLSNQPKISKIYNRYWLYNSLKYLKYLGGLRGFANFADCKQLILA